MAGAGKWLLRSLVLAEKDSRMCLDQQFPLNVEDACANDESPLFPRGNQKATHCFSLFPLKYQCLVLVAKGPRKEAKLRGCSVLLHTLSRDGFCLLGRAVVPKGRLQQQERVSSLSWERKGCRGVMCVLGSGKVSVVGWPDA